MATRSDREGSGAGRADDDARWVEDRTGAVVNTAFIAAALGVARKPPLRECVDLVDRLAADPGLLAAPARTFARELWQIALGRSQLEPWRGDRRYADPAWKTNPIFRGLAQMHSAYFRAAEAVLDATRLEPAADYRLRLALTNVSAALSPANVAPLNPGALKAVIDTNGANLARGGARFVHDMRRPPRLPLRTDPGDFRLGSDVAATRGAVVKRTPLMELVQYATRTRQVRVEPVLIVPSIVNKFYLTDMSPGRSLVEHAARAGNQMFSLSWVNPDDRHREVGLDDYIAAIVEAIDVTRAVSRSDRVHLLGVCAGGQLASIALAHLIATGRGADVGSLTLLVCVLDYARADLPQGLLSKEAAELAVGRIRKRGFVDGRDLTLALAWLRPIDSVWWPWTQRYLLGAPMPKLDLFHWSEDVTNLPAAFVSDQLHVTLNNSLARPGSLEVLGTPIDVGTITHDAYLVAGRTDHLTPWEACYTTTQLLGSTARFVLVDGGHIQSILRPPSERVIPFLHAAQTPPSAQAWLEQADTYAQSWWDDWARWLVERAPEQRPMRRTFGTRGYPPLEPAPGTYVHLRSDRL